MSNETRIQTMIERCKNVSYTDKLMIVCYLRLIYEMEQIGGIKDRRLSIVKLMLKVYLEL